MKKLILIVTIVNTFFIFRADAQFSKGTIMLGTTFGSTGYSSANSDYGYDVGTLKSTGTNTFTFSVGPQVGVFLSPHVVLGATPAFNITTSHVNSTTTNTNSTTTGSATSTTMLTVSLGPFVRYYFAGVSDNNWFYMQVNGAVGTGSGTNSGNSYTANATANTNGKVSNIFTWNTGASVGLTHFFYKRIGMDVALGYNYAHVHNYDTNNTFSTNKNSGNITSSTNNYNLDTGTNGVTFAVGFHWFLKG